MTGTLMLDSDGDLIAAEWEDGAQTIGIAIGVSQVAQSASIAASLKQGSVWWNISAGIDYDGLFYHSNRADGEMNGVRAVAFREAVLSVPGVTGFTSSDQIGFLRRGRTVSVTIPCVEISCDDTRATSDIQILE